MARRVVVTGIGPVTPVGTGRQPFWDALTSGRSGIGEVTQFDASEFPVRIAGEIRDFDPSEHMERKEIRRTDRNVHFAVAAARLAWNDAGEPKTDPQRTAVVISTGIGGLNTLLDQARVLFDRGPGRVSPFMVPGMMPNAAAGQVAMTMGFTGPNTCITTACAAGAHGVGEAYRFIQEGLADVALAGGTEAVITPIAVAGFAQMQALSRNPDPEKASRPFDAQRDGFVLAEGACVLVLEEAEQLEKKTRALLFLAQTGFDGKIQKFENVRIDQLLWDVKETTERLNTKSKIQFDTSLLPENPAKLKVRGNEQLLHLAFTNIINNGCKYSDYQPVHVSIGASDENVIVIIKDSGIGIPIDELKYIYDPFFRASNTKNYEGYGIGLPLTRNIIRMHKGELRVSSATEMGTIVQVNLPTLS
jgi:3-oxoacyl-[acyl-carrier-protein] synthase III